MDGKAQQVRNRRVGGVRIDEEGGPVGGQRGRDADSEGRAPGRVAAMRELTTWSGLPGAATEATPRAMRRERS